MNSLHHPVRDEDDVVRATNRRLLVQGRRRIESISNNVSSSKSLLLRLQVNAIALGLRESDGHFRGGGSRTRPDLFHQRKTSFCQIYSAPLSSITGAQPPACLPDGTREIATPSSDPKRVTFSLCDGSIGDIQNITGITSSDSKHNWRDIVPFKT
jgi:hypothetical protein